MSFGQNTLGKILGVATACPGGAILVILLPGFVTELVSGRLKTPIVSSFFAFWIAACGGMVVYFGTSLYRKFSPVALKRVVATVAVLISLVVAFTLPNVF